MRRETDVRTKNTDVSKVVFHPLLLCLVVSDEENGFNNTGTW
jgi:hypothetical protein